MEKEKVPEGLKQTLLYLPDDLHHQLKIKAATERVTMSEMVTSILYRTFAAAAKAK